MEFVDYKRSSAGEIEFTTHPVLGEVFDTDAPGEATIFVRPVGPEEEEAVRRLMAAEVWPYELDPEPYNRLSVGVWYQPSDHRPVRFEEDGRAQDKLQELQRDVNRVPLRVSPAMCDALLRNKLLNIVADPNTLAEAAEVLGAPARAQSATHTASIEARGWLFASAVAYHLNLGVIPILKNQHRHEDGGGLEEERCGKDGHGQEQLLFVSRELVQGAKVLLVDDWLESGEQAAAARKLIEKSGGQWLGVSVMRDSLENPATRTALEPIFALCPTHRGQWGGWP
jgi:adenine phosphoribosyltransferase